MNSAARQLPPLHELMERRRIRSLGRHWRAGLVRAVAREALAAERARLLGDQARAATRAELLRRVEGAVVEEFERLEQSNFPSVMNATGVLLHTNLGRSSLSAEAAEEVLRVATHPVALEMDLGENRRTVRHARVERWLQLLTGAEAALVLNNGAAALWHAVDGLAPRRKALISRGEMVAVGGSFRMGDILQRTRAKVVEVGATNRTTLQDYARELREGDLVVKVHPSNFRMEGFTADASVADLAGLCREKGAHLHFDAGSGYLYNFDTPGGKRASGHGLAGESGVREALKDGADTVSFSGDKLLGGPQAGLLVGGAAAIAKLGRHPMLRAFRCDKMILAALETTLRAYGRPGRPGLPFHAALGVPQARLNKWARELAAGLEKVLPPGWEMRVVRSEATPGGGSYAMVMIPSFELRLKAPAPALAEELHRLLRRSRPALLARIAEGQVRLDLRSLREEELPVALNVLVEALSDSRLRGDA